MDPIFVSSKENVFEEILKKQETTLKGEVVSEEEWKDLFEDNVLEEELVKEEQVFEERHFEELEPKKCREICFRLHRKGYLVVKSSPQTVEELSECYQNLEQFFCDKKLEKEKWMSFTKDTGYTNDDNEQEFFVVREKELKVDGSNVGKKVLESISKVNNKMWSLCRRALSVLEEGIGAKEDSLTFLVPKEITEDKESILKNILYNNNNNNESDSNNKNNNNNENNNNNKNNNSNNENNNSNNENNNNNKNNNSNNENNNHENNEMERSEEIALGAHFDLGLVSLIPISPTPGLFLMERDTKEWISIEENFSKFSHFVILCGAQLQRQTCNFFTATIHAVIRSNRKRLSMVLQQRANTSCTLDPSKMGSLLVEKRMKNSLSKQEPVNVCNKKYLSKMEKIN